MAQQQGNLGDEEINQIIENVVLNASKNNYISLADKRNLVSSIFASVRGLDVLQELLEDENITEVMVNGINNIFYERSGKLYEHTSHFGNAEKLDDVVQKIAGLRSPLYLDVSGLYGMCHYFGYQEHISMD